MVGHTLNVYTCLHFVRVEMSVRILTRRLERGLLVLASREFIRITRIIHRTINQTYFLQAPPYAVFNEKCVVLIDFFIWSVISSCVELIGNMVPNGFNRRLSVNIFFTILRLPLSRLSQSSKNKKHYNSTQHCHVKIVCQLSFIRLRI